ncbi:DUF4097 family beta strand repeat-containing protein [Parasphingorhabdus pacifica]
MADDTDPAGEHPADGPNPAGEQPGGEPHEIVRHQDFDTDDPIELDISNSAGSVTIELTDAATTHVEIRHDPEAAGFDWRGGLNGLLSWVSEQFGEAGIRTGVPNRESDPRNPAEPISEAVRQTRVDLTGNRLVVRPPTTSPLRTVPLAIKVHAPQGSHIGIRASSAPVAVAGRAGRVEIQSGTGPVSVAHATGNTSVRTGSGPLRLGTMSGEFQARSGRGDIEIATLEQPASVVTGSGNVWLGAVSGDVLVRSGSGDITVADAVEGQTELITGSGQLRVSLHGGVAAEVDLNSSTGTVDSDLDVSEEPPEEGAALRVFGRTGSGDAVLTGAA